MPDAAIDACCLIDLLASGQAEAILRAQPVYVAFACGRYKWKCSIVVNTTRPSRAERSWFRWICHR